MSKQGLAVTASVFLVVAGIGFVFGYLAGRPKQAQKTSKEFVASDPIKAVRSVPKKRIKIDVADIEILDKEEVEKRMPQPPEIRDDPNKQIAATSEVSPDEELGNVQAEAILDSRRGDIRIYMRQVEKPFIGLETQGAFGVGAGWSLKHGQIVKIDGRVSLIRIDRWHIGIEGEVNSEPDARGFIKIERRFH